jgi:hypothetical protein
LGALRRSARLGANGPTVAGRLPGVTRWRARHERSSERGVPTARSGPDEAPGTAGKGAERVADHRQRGPWLPPRWFIRLAWSTHRAIYRVTGGRVGLWRPKPGRWGTLRLTTTGRRTGRPRSHRWDHRSVNLL